MKTKRILSLFLSLLIILGMTQAPAFAEETQTITAFITISQYGEIVSTKDGAPLAVSPVELTGAASYTLDDLFKATHELYYPDGVAGYESYTHEQYGLSLSTLWNDASGNISYQVNGATESVMGLSHEIENGDFVDVSINKSWYPDTEAYSKFDKYTAEIYIGEELELTLNQAGYDENWNMVFSACADAALTVDGAATDALTDSDGKGSLTFDTAGTYLVSAAKFKTVDNETVPAITAPICSVTVKDYPDAKITVPSDAELSAGQKDYSGYNYRPFTTLEPAIVVSGDTAGTSTYYFEIENNKNCNIRISGDNYVTYVDTFKKTANFSLDVTADMLTANGTNKKAVDRDTTSNSGYNTADVYLNINAQGYLKLAAEGDTYQLVNLRNWEAVNTTSSNYFIEPDYHYTVLNEAGAPSSDVISVSDSGLITALGNGTAIVLVTYDAMNAPYAVGGPFFGAIWPENTGVFVVSVGAQESGIVTGMTINDGLNASESKLSGDALDAEHDVIYFAGDAGEYTFTPVTESCSVSVANPTVNTEMTFSGFNTVEKNNDNSFTVPLTEGRNIVKIEKNGSAEYQVITAKKVNVTINNGEVVRPGDTLSIVFDTLYHPANKLAGIYNMRASIAYNAVDAYDGKLIGSPSNQYKFASTQTAQTVNAVIKQGGSMWAPSFTADTDLIVPADYNKDIFTLSGGTLAAIGMGSPYGSHRGITLEVGADPNFSASSNTAYFGILPDIKIPIIATDSALSSIALTTDGVKTDYYEGDSFDPTNLVVTATYEDTTAQIATNYTVSPEILTADTENVTVTYRGMTADIAVNVAPVEVSAIEITTPPSKTSYESGDVFDPTGMVVSIINNNGSKAQTNDYSYAPNRELEVGDTEITVSFTGESTAEIADVTTPITVTAASEGGGSSASNNISVYFTLLGDDKHGAPESDDDTHTNLAGNLKTWVAKTTVTVKKGSYVIDVISKALSIAGIPYSNPDGDYISEIRGLSEFDNGDTSGWMYTLNGRYSSKGISEQTVKNGDKIVLHYTDDYTVERTSFVNSSSGGSSSSSKDKTIAAEPQVETAVTEPKPEFNESTYSDVNKNDWHYEAVKYAYENNLMQGTGKGFEPDSKMSRAMLVTVLYRLEKDAVAAKSNAFSDVSPDAWYADSVAWASENGIVSGISKTEFAPDENISREQMAVIIYRYAKLKGYDVSASSELSAFADSADISTWALDAFCWANASALISGIDDVTVAPKGTATRAQVATILMRFCENIAK